VAARRVTGYLLDASFVIAFLREVEARQEGDARRFLSSLRRARVYLSVVAYAEVLEEAEDPAELATALRVRFRFQSIGQDVAERVALIQRRSARRMGENDAWIAATAMKADLTLVGDDDQAFVGRAPLRYVNFRRPPESSQARRDHRS
jgi:predicted nucleic acid-binding protein